jgi:glycosyltransferase involved in cell wall biosynthesis
MQGDRQHVGEKDRDLKGDADESVQYERHGEVDGRNRCAGGAVSNQRAGERRPEKRPNGLHANILPVLEPVPHIPTSAPDALTGRSIASQTPGAVHAEIELFVPDDDVAEPDLSIVIPALNEELTITDFVAWCRQGLRDAGVQGEILIIDSSTDRTPELARAAGARVLRVPKRGLGRAYTDAVPYIRGRWVLMGDADCTYDFRLLNPFVEKFEQGYEYVMGSRWEGSIEPGSMPWLHQHLGTPATTWILNRLFSSKFTDIHCGMRGITRDALINMGLQSQSWEYASEMVLKSVHMNLRTTEVPVRFLADREGRVSHHKRLGWFSPWQAAWINLRAMFIYGSDFFVLKPGFVLAVLGLIVTLAVSFGNLKLGAVTLSLNWQFLAVGAFVVGLQAFFLGGIAQVLFDFTGRRRKRWLRAFPYTRTVLIAALLVLIGIGLAVPLAIAYLNNNLALTSANYVQDHLAVTGLAAAIAGTQLFVFVLLLHGAIVATSWGRPFRAD